MISFSIIVAIDSKRGIGKAGKLPWDLPGDMKHFKSLTTTTKSLEKQNVVIMGRKTWDSIPEKFRPLSDRINLILTRNQNPKLPSDVFFSDSLEKALCLFEKSSHKEKIADIFIIGGEQIFEVALQMSACKKIYFTQIKKSLDCDTFFPEFKRQFERKTTSAPFQENGISYFFSEYERRYTALDVPLCYIEAMERETRLRSFLKGLSWRILASTTTIGIAYLITGDTSVALGIGGIEAVLKVFFYYLHERAWQALPRGTIRHIETEVLSKRRKKT